MTLEEIRRQIRQLSSDDFAKLCQWLDECQAILWDEQIERDASNGRLDGWLQQVDTEIEAGKAQPL